MATTEHNQWDSLRSEQKWIKQNKSHQDSGNVMIISVKKSIAKISQNVNQLCKNRLLEAEPEFAV